MYISPLQQPIVIKYGPIIVKIIKIKLLLERTVVFQCRIVQHVVFSVLALIFCPSGRILLRPPASTKYWPPQQNISANTENTG